MTVALLAWFAGAFLLGAAIGFYSDAVIMFGRVLVRGWLSFGTVAFLAGCLFGAVLRAAL